MSERNASQAQWVALHGGQPLVVLLYEHSQHCADLLAQLPLLLDEGVPCRQTAQVAEVFAAPNTVILLCPDNEEEALRALSGQRELLVDRSQPVVLFLLRGGSAQQLFSDAAMAGLSSWLQGSILDIHALETPNPAAGSDEFAALTGQTPADWLRAWLHGALEDSLDNQLLYHRAVLLAPPHT